MKIAVEEFNRFWDEVLGGDWYIDEGGPEDDDPVVDLADMWLSWQGDGEPSPKGLITARDLPEGSRSLLKASNVFRRWKKAQTTTVVVATFDIPNDQLAGVRAAIKALGGKILG